MAARAVDAIADPLLRAFVEGLVKDADAGQRFEQFMHLIEAFMERTLPGGVIEKSSLVSMIGRPLALVHAEARFERKGGPILNPHWLTMEDALEALPRSFDEAAKAVGDTAKSPEASVRIGSRLLPDDGVVGYYVDPDMRTIHATEKVEIAAGFTHAIKGGLTLEAPLGDEAAPGAARLTFLLDPRGKIYLGADLLPVTTSALAPEDYEEELGRLPAVVRAAPVLVASSEALRSVLAGANPTGEKARIDLPVPVGTPDARAALHVDGAEFAVEPTRAMSAALGDIAAVEGTLVLSTLLQG
jgi:hypothetical protein